MKVTVFGAGAIGGHLGALLAHDGVDVSLVARGPHMAAMRDNGLKLITPDREIVTHPRVTDDAATLGPQDYVVVSLKSHQAPGAVDAIRTLLGPETTVATAMNGVPWWYFHKLPGPWEGHRVASVDPDGAQWDGIGPERAIGCITYVAGEVIEPGVVKAGGNPRYFIGEPDGSMSERATRFCEIATAAGIDARLRPALRDDIWIKLMGNVAYNPISALTMGTSGDMVGDPDVEIILRQVMTEVLNVGRALGAEPNASIDDRLAGTRVRASLHKTSMLQDLERGRPMEIDQIVRATAELGKLAEVVTPTIDTVLALVSLRARLAGLLPV
jgi:2-dehydropantoate 2-reductase